MSNFDPGIVPAEGQDYNAQQEIYDPLVSINDQLSRLNLNFKAETLQLEGDTPEGSFESALKGVLSRRDYTKHQLADAIESLFYSKYNPILDALSTSTVIVTFDGNDKLDTVYKRSSINQETACNGFGYHTKTNSLFKLVLKLQSLNNDQNVASKTTDFSISNCMRILQGLTSPNQLQAPSSSNQQQDPLKDVFTSLYQIHPNHVTSIDLVDVEALAELTTETHDQDNNQNWSSTLDVNWLSTLDVVTLAELTTEINDQDNNQNWSSILSGPPIDPDTAIKSHIDYFVRKYFRSNSKPISNESLERLEFELKKPRSNDVIEFIRVHKGRDLGDIRTLYEKHLENRKEYCRIINEICTIISTKDVPAQIISRFRCTIKDLVNNEITPFTAEVIASQTASFCDSLCDNHESFTLDQIMAHMKFVNDSIQKLENTSDSNRSQIQPLIASMKFSSSQASKKLVDLGFKGIGATPEPPEDVQSSVEQSLQMIQDWAELLPLSITEAYRDFRACRGLSKIIINQVQDQKNAEIRPPASATEVPHIWNCYPSSPHSDLLHIVPWRKGPENIYYRPSDTPTHCVVAAIGWSEWTGFDQRVKDATDGILGTEEFNSFQRDIWRAVANFLPSLFDVCEELLANGTEYDFNHVILAGKNKKYTSPTTVNKWLKGTIDDETTNQTLYERICKNSKSNPLHKKYCGQYELMVNVHKVVKPTDLLSFLSSSPGRPPFTQNILNNMKPSVGQDRCHEISDFYLFEKIIKQFEEDTFENVQVNLARLSADIFGDVVSQDDLARFNDDIADVILKCQNIVSLETKYYRYLPELDAAVARLHQTISSFSNNLRPGHLSSNRSIQEAVDPCPKPYSAVQDGKTVEIFVLSSVAARLFEATCALLLDDNNKNKKWVDIEKKKWEHFDVVQDNITKNGAPHEIDPTYIYVKTSDKTQYTTPIPKKLSRAFVYRIKSKKNDEDFFEVEGRVSN